MPKITKITALEILDSRGNPTMRATVELENGVSASASVPSGASTGKHEALELRDNDTRYGGMGVLTACENINRAIAKKIVGLDGLDQKKIDGAMIELDGTENKSNLGANAILAVSLATARTAAKAQNLPLYKYLAKSHKFKMPKKIPAALFNVINGGAHADSGLSVQEFHILPRGFEKFSEKLRVASEIYHKLKEILVNSGYQTGVGDEGGFAPKLESHNEAFEKIRRAVEECGYGFKDTVSVGIDAASSEFFNETERAYVLKPENTSFSAERFVSLLNEWKNKFNLFFIEDGLEEDDFESWKLLNSKIGSSTLIIGDDFLATNIARLEKALSFKAVNAAIVKPNQIGTLTETIGFIKTCQKNKVSVIISHRSGETEDTFIADLAVATSAEYVKFGAPCRGERTAKYNRLLEIEREIR